MRGRAQTATEYIIIIAVVIVIALVAAVVLGVFPGIGGEVDNKAEEYELTTNPVSIDGIGATDDETRLILRNNFVRNIDVNDLSIEGKSCSTTNLPRTLKVGQKSLISCTNINSSLVQDGFTPSVSVLWCDNLLEQAFTFTEGAAEANFTYTGECAAANTTSSSSGFSPPTTPPPQVSSCNALGSAPVAAFFNGSGTPTDRYGICNCTMLQDMLLDPEANYQLLSNIDCSSTSSWNGGSGFEPVGDTGTVFNGTFRGNNYTINDLFIDRPITNEVGLFGTAADTNIYDAGLDSPFVRGSTRVGGFVGYNWYDSSYSGSSFDNIYAIDAEIRGVQFVGGLIGDIYYQPSLDNVFVTGNVTGTSNDVGGLIGESYYGFDLDNSFFIGNVTGLSRVGGLIGHSYDSFQVDNSFVRGNISGTTRVGGVGGLIGPTGVWTDINFTGNVTGTGNYVGGIIGEISDTGASITLDNIRVIGDVSGGSDVGGLIGENFYSTTIDNSFFRGTVTGTSNQVGGLVGYAYDTTNVDNSFVVGDIEGTSYSGGLIGSSYSGAVVDNSYFIGNVDGTSKTGGVLGANRNGVSWSNVSAKGNVTGTVQLGGIIGYSRYSSVVLDNVRSNVTVEGTGGSVGGLVGYIGYGGTITNSYNTKNVTASSKTGGLVGYARYGGINLNNNYNEGNITSTSGTGGLIGYVYYGQLANVDNSYNLGNVEGTSSVGGIVGYAYRADIDTSYVVADVLGTVNVGGIIGREYYGDSIDNTYFSGNVSGTSSVGGIIGRAELGPGGYFEINNVYATGVVDSTGSAGGLVGSTPGVEMSDSFVTSEISGSPAYIFGDDQSIGSNLHMFNQTDDADKCDPDFNLACTEQTPISYFYTITNAPLSSWNFATVWSNANDGVNYPTLQ